MVRSGGFGAAARITVEEVHEGLMSVVVKMVDLVSPCEQVRDGLWGWFVGDCGADDVGHVTVIELRRDSKFGVAVEAAESCKMDIPTQNCDTDAVLLSKGLQLVDEFSAFVFMLSGGVMIVEVIEEINLAVKMIEEAACDTEAFVEETNWPYDRGVEDIFQPG